MATKKENGANPPAIESDDLQQEGAPSAGDTTSSAESGDGLESAGLPQSGEDAGSQAPPAPPEPTPFEEPESFVVLSSFRDKDNFEIRYEEGLDVTHWSPERIRELIGKGLVGKRTD